MPHARSLAFLALLAGAATAGAQTCGDGVPERGPRLCVSAPVEAFETNGEVRTVLAQDVNGDARPDIVAVTPTAVYVRFGAPGGLGATVRRVYGGDLTDAAVFDLEGGAGTIPRRRSLSAARPRWPRSAAR